VAASNMKTHTSYRLLWRKWNACPHAAVYVD